MICLPFRARTAHQLLIAATLAVTATRVPAQTPAPPPLRFVVSARQLGPVGYRDPLAVISPDGEWIAYTSGVSLRLMHSSGGPVQILQGGRMVGAPFIVGVNSATGESRAKRSAFRLQA